MTSYLSNLLTNTTSKYNQLRRTLLSDETDGDIEDDSHISRVLRAYYVEKGRPLPPWLPPDPNSKHTYSAHSQPAQYDPYGNQQQVMPAPQRRPGGLGSLWDSPQGQNGPPQPQSLRRGGAPMNSAQPPMAARGPERFSGGANESARMAAGGPRPLPSQRDGSYQSLRSQRTSGSGQAENMAQTAASTAAVGGGTAQDRLKARLWGGTGGQRPNSPGYPPAR